MTTEYQYIQFQDITSNKNHSTKTWDVRNKKYGGLLGRIGWYSTWRQYVFIPTNAICQLCTNQFSVGQLMEIVDFIGKIKK